MFTGIIEDCGRVIYIRRDKICIESRLGDLNTGDSIMVNGVCLTIIEIQGGRKYIMDIGAETLKKTAFSKLKPGSLVNLERAMSFGARINGHIVYGHVMAVGRIMSSKLSGNTKVVTIGADRKFLDKLVEKGSVAVNGVSLTVNRILKNSFTIGIVPETVKRTNLGKITSASLVNLEADMMIMKK